jgi:hypothetical protein
MESAKFFPDDCCIKHINNSITFKSLVVDQQLLPQNMAKQVSETNRLASQTTITIKVLQ